MAVLCGTCAWADHHNFYPRRLKPADRLAFYAEYFPLVEVDSSYYGIPTPESAREWVRQTPERFVFDVKAYRTLTQHDRGAASPLALDEDFTAFTRAVDVLAHSGKLGLLLFQFPPWFVHNGRNRDYVERVVRRMSDYTLGIEFRHRSWFEGTVREETVAWMRTQHVVNVVCDEPQIGMGTVPTVADVTHPDLVMFRLHGRNGEMWYEKGLTSSQQRFDYKYSRDELAELLPMVEQWAQASRDVHILMNNNQGDYAVTNALDWQAILGQPVRGRPERTDSAQLTLFDMDSMEETT